MPAALRLSGEVKQVPGEIALFRKSIAAVQFFYYLSLFPRFSEFFGAHGWMKNTARQDFFSLLFWSDAFWWRWVLMLTILACLVMLWKGVLNRWGLLLFYIINLSFYIWNPLITHEPQPLMNLFFLSFFLLPLNDQQEYDPWIKHGLILFLGVYYFTAGIKKLPDPHFLDGSALGSIISWPVMAKNMALNQWIASHFGWALRVMNYATLFFEISFLFLVYTRFRVYLLFFGVLLHALIYATLEVGHLSFVMIAWYTLLLDEPTRSRITQFKFAPTRM